MDGKNIDNKDLHQSMKEFRLKVETDTSHMTFKNI
jgi:hypothetical protein